MCTLEPTEKVELLRYQKALIKRQSHPAKWHDGVCPTENIALKPQYIVKFGCLVLQKIDELSCYSRVYFIAMVKFRLCMC